uniref:Uncharacterized protein n=1 Tax=Arundo donax TaxID=35708 RepID=A0A0A9F8S1_ARUDO
MSTSSHIYASLNRLTATYLFHTGQKRDLFCFVFQGSCNMSIKILGNLTIAAWEIWKPHT